MHADIAIYAAITSKLNTKNMNEHIPLETDKPKALEPSSQHHNPKIPIVSPVLKCYPRGFGDIGPTPNKHKQMQRQKLRARIYCGNTRLYHIIKYFERVKPNS